MCAWCKHVEERLTPTCVGRTGRQDAGSNRREAHPHVRGEDVNRPRAAGNRDWLTPTCVGRTSSAKTGR